MKNRTHIYIVVLIAFIAMCGCEHHHLYYSTSSSAEVTINVDWTQSNITNPNGITAIAYYENGELYRQFPPFSNTSQIQLALPEGVFDVILYNNTNSEFEYINFDATSNFSTALASTVSKTPVRTLEGEDVGKDVVNDPDKFASAVVSKVEVTSSMIEYFYSQPDYYYTTYDKEFQAYMLPRTVQVFVYADVTDIRYAAAAPYTFFKHFAGGFLLGQEVADSRQVIQEFVLNNIIYEDATQQNGRIMKEFTSFGKVTDPSADYYVDILFLLLDGKYEQYVFNVTDQIIIKYDSDGLPYIEIYLSLTLPYATGDSSGADASTGLGTDVEIWDNVGATLPM